MAKVAPASKVQNSDPSQPFKTTDVPSKTSKSAEQILDPEKLLDETWLSPATTAPPEPLPKQLVDFKEYVDSKFCYYAEPVNYSQLIDVRPKVAYECHMKILIEERRIEWVRTAHRWENETVLGSQTLGMLSTLIKRAPASLLYSMGICQVPGDYDDCYLSQ